MPVGKHWIFLTHLDKRHALASGACFASSVSPKVLLTQANSAINTDCGILSCNHARFSITSSGLNHLGTGPHLGKMELPREQFCPLPSPLVAPRGRTGLFWLVLLPPLSIRPPAQQASLSVALHSTHKTLPSAAAIWLGCQC